jgi:hypothetical protein
LLSSVKRQASSASRIILAYRHRGRGRARSGGQDGARTVSRSGGHRRAGADRDPRQAAAADAEIKRLKAAADIEIAQWKARQWAEIERLKVGLKAELHAVGTGAADPERSRGASS